MGCSDPRETKLPLPLCQGRIHCSRYRILKQKRLVCWIDCLLFFKTMPSKYSHERLGLVANRYSDAILVNATINCLGILIRTRPTIANTILETLLNFNPIKIDHGHLTPTMRVKIKSMERTTRAVLINLLKRFVLNVDELTNMLLTDLLQKPESSPSWKDAATHGTIGAELHRSI